MNDGLLRQRIWAGILLAYFILLLATALSGLLARFVEQNLVVAVVISAGVLGTAGALRLIGPATLLADPQHGFIVFLFPLAFVALGALYSGPPASVFAGHEASAFTSDGFPAAVPAWSSSALQLRSPRTAGTQAPPAVPREISTREEDPSITDLQTVYFDDELYFRYYSLLYEQPHLFEGRTVVVRGFAGREPSFPGNRFYLARRLLWCCTLDASLLPLLAESDRASVPRTGQWVEIEAVVETTLFTAGNGATAIPLLRVREIRPIEAPEFEYVFPF